MYAFSLYQLRHKQIIYHELHVAKTLENFITTNDLMKFSMTDIEVLRKEMGKLIDNLSLVYLHEKNK
jgi:hypothetical protein